MTLMASLRVSVVGEETSLVFDDPHLNIADLIRRLPVAFSPG